MSFTDSVITFHVYPTTFVSDFADTLPKVPRGYTFTAQHSLTVGGHILSMRKQTFKIDVLLPGRFNSQMFP